MNIRMMVRGLAWDVGLPVVTYYALHLFGVSDWVALLASTLVAAARIGWVAIRERTLNLFATVMLIVFGLGLLLTFVSGDPRFLLVKESFVTGAVGIAFLVTAAVGRRPLTLVYLLPIDVMVGVSTAMMVAVFTGLVLWNARWVARAQSR